ncbi:DUF1285 domain-containing protein [Moraxella sp. Tifton1]|uniref:DUF1285 domain-containing protein n=1 Tax=Moraxella oculi TaxID=2940516 RepID=UPI0020116C9A|nr:DUF1285 domain-containing protein [Moraxella sp. Tifton1]MCL1623087.1 DUF1285 domain-containing protein [Moraxella sp. Tifton1]
MTQKNDEITDNQSKNINKNNTIDKLLSEIGNQSSQRKTPPLDAWYPSRVHDFDVVIKDNGEWHHAGSKMTRQSLIDLFASVLWGQVENGQAQYFLKTPSDLYRIQVDDAPLLINTVDEIEQDGEKWIVFGTTTGDQIMLGDDSLYFKEFDKDGRKEQRLYIDARFGLVARISNNVLYHLVEMGELCELGDKTALILKSGGRTHHVEVPND